MSGVSRDYYAGRQRGLAEGREQEQERIIKLLERLKGTCSGDCDDCRTYAHTAAHYLTAIQELIKGEQGVIQVSERDYDQIVEAIKGEK